MSDVTVKFGADISEIKKAGAKMAGELKGVGASLAAPLAGLVSAGAFAALTKQVIDFADELDDNAKKLGVTTEAYQQLDYMARVAGADMGSVGTAIKMISGDLTDAANGNQEAAAKFGILGLAIEDLKGLSPDKLFEAVAKKIADIKDPTERTARAVDMFGRGGQQILGMAQDFDELKKQASETASILDSETIAAAARFNDTMTALFTNIAAGIGQSGLIKWLADASEGMIKFAKLSDMAKSNNVTSQDSAYEGGVKGFVSNWLSGVGFESKGMRMDLKDEDRQKLEAYKKKAEAARKEGKTGKDIEADEAAAKAAKEEDIKRETAARKIREAQEKLEEAGRKELADAEKKIQLDAMRAAGMEKQASMLEKELVLREKLGRSLTGEEYNRIEQIAGNEELLRDLKDSEKGMDFGKPETESAIGLERIGAVYRGAGDSGYMRIVTQQLDQQRQIKEAVAQIANKSTSGERLD